MARWRIITVPLLMMLPFGIAGILGARHTPSTLPPCLHTATSVDFQRSAIDGIWFRQIEISNCGGAPVALDTVVIDGAGHAAGFSVLGPAAGLVDVNTPLTLTVGFTPGRVGQHIGALRIAAGDSLLEVGLVGEGVPPGGRAMRSPPCTAALPGGFVSRGACAGSGRTTRLTPGLGTPLDGRSATSPPDASVTDGQPPAT